MSKKRQLPPIGWDVIGATLSAVGMALFILPVLALPLSGLGFIWGLIGIALAAWTKQFSLRLSVAGTLFSGLVFCVVAAIALANGGYFAPRTVFPELRPMYSRPSVSPPAQPEAGPAQR